MKLKKEIKLRTPFFYEFLWARAQIRTYTWDFFWYNIPHIQTNTHTHFVGKKNFPKEFYEFGEKARNLYPDTDYVVKP